jgi:murein DD-endopeptidase MepM/ murein hydrolase activator NlpD
MRRATGRAPSANWGATGILLLALAAGPGPASAQVDQPALGSTIKRISAPKSGGIGGLEGFSGHSSVSGSALGLAGDRDRQIPRFNQTVTRGPGGEILRVITLGSPVGTPPLPRPKPSRAAEFETASLAPGLSGGGPTRLRPGMRSLRWPLRGALVSSGYGLRKHPVLGKTRRHYGVDLPAPYGTPVRAAADGVVRYRGRNGGYGRFIRIDHGFGLETAYGHLRRYALGLRRDRRVRRGETVGYVGSSGLSTGPHLHYEVRINGRAIDPMGVMPNAPRRVRVQ